METLKINNRKISASSLLIMVLFFIFLAEFLVMMFISELYPFLVPVEHILIYSALLVIITTPFFYFLIFKVIIKKEREKEEVEKKAMRVLEIIELSTDIVFIAEPKNYDIIYLNKAARKYLKISDNSKVNISDIYPGKMREMIINESIPEAVKNGIWEGEICYLSSGDGIKCLFSQLIIIKKGGDKEIEYIAGIMHDIFNRKKYEEEIENHMKELEKLNEVMVGREERMTELKKEIKDLREKIKE